MLITKHNQVYIYAFNIWCFQNEYVLEIESAIPVTQHMKALKFSLDFDDCTGKVIIYNPDKWRYVEFYFFEKVPNAAFNSKVYRLLHLSM